LVTFLVVWLVTSAKRGRHRSTEPRGGGFLLFPANQVMAMGMPDAIAIASAHLFGAACPQRRVAVMPAANAETMSLHLTAIGRKVAADSHAALVLDGAGYHIAAALTISESLPLWQVILVAIAWMHFTA
jgi:hypothetical protein